MNSFCLERQHRRVPQGVRKKFNELVFNLFEECPLSDLDLSGCTTRYLEIDWISFTRYITARSKFSETEKKEVAKKFGAFKK